MSIDCSTWSHQSDQIHRKTIGRIDSITPVRPYRTVDVVLLYSTKLQHQWISGSLAIKAVGSGDVPIGSVKRRRVHVLSTYHRTVMPPNIHLRVQYKYTLCKNTSQFVGHMHPYDK